MKFLIKFKGFLESYLLSNRAPLYHHTQVNTLLSIITSNKIDVGYYDNEYNKRQIKTVSLTRDPKLNIEHIRDMSNTRIELDADKLRRYYRIIPYDFFSKGLPKSDPKRKDIVEAEEVCLYAIDNLSNYLVSIEIRNFYEFLVIKDRLLPLLDKNVKLTIYGQRYLF